jgi:hypothetical protein
VRAATEPAVVRARPRTALLGTAVLTLFVVTAPLYGVLYWLAVPRGLLWQTLSGHVAILVIGSAVGARQLAVFVEVRGGRLSGNGIFSPTVHAELSRIDRVDIVATYVGMRPAPVRQLLVRDAEGRRLFRMRGNFWGDDVLTHVAAALPVTPALVAEPIDLPDFFRRYPGSAYWFENRPAVLAVAIVLGVAAAVSVAAGAIALSGQPFAV